MEQKTLDFGDICLIEQKRYGVPNEMYDYKVIGRLRSNTWVDVPVQTPAIELTHNQMEDVVACICRGINEGDVRKFRLSDVMLTPSPAKPPVNGEEEPNEYTGAEAIKCGELIDKHIGGMAQLEKASVRHFIEKGTINGSFRLRLLAMMQFYRWHIVRQYSTPQESPAKAEQEGLRWVKAEDRQPPNNNLVHMRYSTKGTKFMLTGYYELSKEYWYNQNNNVLDWAPNLEWLEEL